MATAASSPPSPASPGSPPPASPPPARQIGPRHAEAGGPRRLVPAVDRAVRLLGVLAAAPDGLTLTEVASALGAGKSSVHDLLATLVHHGVVQRDGASRRFRLGPRLAELARLADGRADPAAAIHELLREGAAATGESVLLASWSGRTFVVLDSVTSTADLRITAPPGTVLHPLTGAFGKVLAAFGTIPQGAGWPRTGAWASAERLRQAAEAVRRDGVAVDDEEYLEGVWGVSAPVLAGGDRLVGALTVVGLKGSAGRTSIEAAAAVARSIAHRIADTLQRSGLTGLPAGAAAEWRHRPD